MSKSKLVRQKPPRLIVTSHGWGLAYLARGCVTLSHLNIQRAEFCCSDGSTSSQASQHSCSIGAIPEMLPKASQLSELAETEPLRKVSETQLCAILEVLSLIIPTISHFLHPILCAASLLSSPWFVFYFPAPVVIGH